MTKVYRPPSYDYWRKIWLEKNVHINIYVPPEIKERIDNTVKILGNTTITKWCSEAFLSLFSEENQCGSVMDSVTKSERILEGMKKFGEFHFKKSITGKFCDVNGCGGKMVKLSYPILNGDKVEIIPVDSIICEKCGSIKEG